MRFLCLLAVTFTVALLALSRADDSDEEKSTAICDGYEVDVYTKPDNKRKVFAKKNKDYEITTIQNVRRDKNTVYWCDLKIPDVDDVMQHYKHYDHNATHFWVEKGCSGTFKIEECDTSSVKDGGPKKTSGKSSMQGSLAKPKDAGKDWKKVMKDSRFDMNVVDKQGPNLV